MNDYTYVSVSASATDTYSSTYTWIPDGYYAWDGITSASTAHSPRITIDSNGPLGSASAAWHFITDADGDMHSAKEWEMEYVSAEELDDVLGEVS